MRTIREELDRLGDGHQPDIHFSTHFVCTTVSLALNSVVTATGLIGAFFAFSVSHARLLATWGDRKLHDPPWTSSFRDQGVVRALIAGLIAYYKSVGGDQPGRQAVVKPWCLPSLSCFVIQHHVVTTQSASWLMVSTRHDGSSSK